MDELKFLGKEAREAIGASDLERVRTQSEVMEVVFTTSELQARCPVTHQPDIYDLTLSYSAPSSLESKSLKLYLMSFRERGIFAEDLAAELARDVCKTVGGYTTVELRQHVRGGLVLTVHAAAVV